MKFVWPFKVATLYKYQICGNFRLKSNNCDLNQVSQFIDNKFQILLKTNFETFLKKEEEEECKEKQENENWLEKLSSENSTKKKL